eukprot:12447246-Ditylum_brightwellii.AAC.1
MAKLSGETNSQYTAFVLNSSLALAASGNQKIYKFVVGNLGLISPRHAQRLFASTRQPPFINLTFVETVQKLCSHFHKVCQAMGRSFKPIAFTVGINATIVAKTLQLLQSHGPIMGGVYLNHFLDVKRKSDEETVKLMKECIMGNMVPGCVLAPLPAPHIPAPSTNNFSN